jgi:Bacterial Ig-like domain (group 3)/FG-GAP-like repeat/Abnormal spindle-like microcephaly-assoc'd, ASPM-SPD-2-Hydin/FG-GAP repeat
MFLFRLNDFHLPKISRKSGTTHQRQRSYNTPGRQLALRRAAISYFSAAVVLTASAAQAQQSNGLTFYHLADATTKDNSGSTLTSIKPGPQTDGSAVAFENGSATTACDSAASLYTVPITGGSVSTLAGPGIQVESSEPSGTATVLCNHLVLSGSTLFYPANYTPTGASLRSGIFKLPIAGGASADVFATGDATPVENFQTSGGTRVTQPGTVASVATTTFSVDPSANLIADYTANFTAGGPYSFNTINLYGYPPLLGGPGIRATTSCPGVTVPVQGGAVSSGLTVGMESGYSENAPWYADIVGGTGTNYAGATVGMQFLRIAIWPYGGCDSVVFGPDLGSLNGGTTFILPGEPLPNTSTPVSTMNMGAVAISNGVVYLSASQFLSTTQGSYSGFFTVADNFTGANGSSGAFPLPNGQWPANLNPIPTKIISNYDPVPGITLGLTTCPGGVSQIPAMGTFFTVAGNYLVFAEVQALQNCSTMATSTAGGIYAYNLTTKTVQLIVPYGASLVLGDPGVTALNAILPGALSPDGHLAFVVGTTIAGSSTTTQTLYSTYLPQQITAVSLTTSGTTVTGGSVTLTAVVSPNTGAANQATGSVRFMDGATVLGTQTIDSTGTAAFTTSTLSSGPHTLRAIYTGDTLYEGATSATVSLANGKATLVLTLTSPSTIFVGQTVTATAQLSTEDGIPTGKIAFSAGGAALGAATIGSNGSAALAIPMLPAGTTQIVATYTGDSNFNAAVSAPDPVLVLTNTPVNLTPHTLTFPTQALGTTSSPQILTLTNFNGTPIPVGSITISGDFAQTNTCGTAVTPGSECFISVTFAPKTAGAAAGTLTVPSNGTSAAQIVTLNGTTLPPTISSTTTTIINSGAAGDYTLTGTVIGVRSTDAPAGTVSFVDASNNNLSLGTAALGAGTPGLSLAVFSPPSSGMGPNAIAVGDFNGDGKPDIATTNSGGSVGIRTAGGPPGILLGNGDGTFTAGTTPVTPTHALVIATADFNGDGKLDLVVDGGTNGGLIILLGNGDGTFSVAPTQVTSFDPTFVVTGDFNGDGRMDIAALNGNAVTVLLGNGNATFTQGSNYSTGQYPSSIAIADFNHDGKSDLAIQNSGDGTITMLLGVGDGTFTSAASVISKQNASTLVVGDFNGDGKPDLATSFQDSPNNYANTLIVFLGNGDGTFQSVNSSATDSGTENYTVTAADFNSDGKSDLVFGDDNNVSVLLSKGDGTFTLAASTPGATTSPSYFSLITADFNGDGVPDIATADGDLDTVGVLLTQRTQTAVATLGNLSIPGAGTHNIQAVYAGDTNFSASTSATIPLTASQIATTLQLTSSPGSAASGAQITLTATVSPYSSGNLTTTGETITFSNNGTSIGTGILTSGVATLNTTSLPVGSNSLTATYAGDSSFGSATSAAVPVVITAPTAPTAPAVTLSPTSLTFALQTVGTTAAAQAVTLTNSGQVALTLTSIASSGDFDQSNNCGATVAPGASCTIAVTFTPTAAGTRTGTVSITDNAAGSPQTVALSGGADAVSLSPGSSSLSIASPGGTASTAIQLSALDGFTGTVNLTCAVSYQGTGTPAAAPTCSLSPTQVQVTGSTPVSTTLTISTTAASASVRLQRNFNQSLIAFAGLIFLGAIPRRLWRGRLLIVALCLITLGGMIGCGGGNSGGTGTTPTPIPGTTTGNYQVVVTGTSGALKVSTTISLSIQ